MYQYIIIAFFALWSWFGGLPLMIALPLTVVTLYISDYGPWMREMCLDPLLKYVAEKNEMLLHYAQVHPHWAVIEGALALIVGCGVGIMFSISVNENEIDAFFKPKFWMLFPVVTYGLLVLMMA